MCLWDLGAWTSVRCFGAITISWWRTSVELFTFFQGKKFCSLQALTWHSKTHIWCELSQCLNVLLKKHLRAQEPSFSHVWGYWNLLFTSETEKDHITSLLRTSYQQTGLWMSHCGDSWLSACTAFMISSRAYLISYLISSHLSHLFGDDYLGMALCFTVPTPLT